MAAQKLHPVLHPVTLNDRSDAKYWAYALERVLSCHRSLARCVVGWVISAKNRACFEKPQFAESFQNPRVLCGLREAKTPNRHPTPSQLGSRSRASKGWETARWGRNRAFLAISVHDRTLIDGEHGAKRCVDGCFVGRGRSRDHTWPCVWTRFAWVSRLGRSFARTPTRRGSVAKRLAPIPLSEIFDKGFSGVSDVAFSRKKGPVEPI